MIQHNILMFEATRPWRTTRTPDWSLIIHSRNGHPEAVSNNNSGGSIQTTTAISRGLRPAEACDQQRQERADTGN